ncbi:hypothetical protein Pmani_038012 [Petrolisthes manimaculis]|uniref:Uncharacterized protein n=1 Tax=Petrolisthes manimaculis TaxID=1843537 RepID=A0AAE1TMR5_9EUCA|nr:hypothetical protein Pmani_038012 [Petrolisthes manimaculis]
MVQWTGKKFALVSMGMSLVEREAVEKWMEIEKEGAGQKGMGHDRNKMGTEKMERGGGNKVSRLSILSRKRNGESKQMRSTTRYEKRRSLRGGEVEAGGRGRSEPNPSPP